MKKSKPAGRRLPALLGISVLLLLIVAIVGVLPGKPTDGVSFSRTYTDRNGKLLRIFLTADEKYRSWRGLAEFPPEMVEAVILQEDRYFYRHPGVNPVTLVKAFKTTYVTKERRVGASTITMQLARLLYDLDSSKIGGKLIQIFRALWLEARFSKQELLEAYLNLVPCGRNIEGFPAAAYFYFGTDLRELSLSQMLLLCVIPQNPAKRAPSAEGKPDELLRARSILFETWLGEHPEDDGSHAEIEMPVAIVAAFPFKAPHQTEYLEKTLPEKPRNIRTTIDADLQGRCETVVSRYLEGRQGEGVNNAALLVVDWRTMEIAAAIGSADYRDDRIQGQVNGTTARRSPGSTLKPFIYAMALDQGLIHADSMLRDTPTSFSEYTPDNYGKDFAGPIKAWRALVDSRNIPAIALASRLRGSDLYDFLSRSGIGDLEERDHYGLSIVLGSAGLTMMELVRLYALLPNGGEERELVGVLSSRTPGKTERRRGTERVLSPAACWITRAMLERNPPPFATGGSGGLPPVAFKTGTSIGFRDAWTVGICDRWIVCAWLGNFDGRGQPVFNGRALAAPLVFRVLETLVASTPPSDLLSPIPPPSGVSAVQVCEVSGALPGSHCTKTEEAWFIPGVSPIGICAIHREIAVDARTGWRTDEREGEYVRKIVREFWPSDLLESFRQAGLPRLSPPPYPDERTGMSGRYRGFPPVIASPLSNATYVLRLASEKRKSLVLIASADADSKELFWFADDVFIGKSAPNGTLLWEPDPGSYILTVLDERGRSASTPVVVELRE